jgi:hypothetical protein
VFVHLSGPLVDLGQSAESPQDVRKPPSAANGYQRINLQVRGNFGVFSQVVKLLSRLLQIFGALVAGQF